MTEKARVLVIGSNSFSGGDFIDLLLSEGRFSVMGVSRSPEKDPWFLPYRYYCSRDFTFQQIDLNTQMDALMSQIDNFRPDYVVNFAAQGEVGSSWKWPAHWFQTNAVAITELVHRLKDRSFIKKYVQISTPEVYGSCEHPIDEQAALKPSTPYAASKAAGDLSAMAYAQNCGLPLVMIRATNIYGPGQQLYRIIPRSIINIRKGNYIELHGGGKAVKSYIHIRDVSRGEMLAMEHGREGEVYHFSPDKGISIRTLVEEICGCMGVHPENVIRDVEERLGQDAAYTIDSSKSRNELHWTPEIHLDKGIMQVVDWVEQYWKHLEGLPQEYVHMV